MATVATFCAVVFATEIACVIFQNRPVTRTINQSQYFGRVSRPKVFVAAKTRGHTVKVASVATDASRTVGVFITTVILTSVNVHW